jgi:FkbH-like protein
VLLCCGFSPLHLQTYLAAHLRAPVGDRPIQIDTGAYGDLLGTLRRSQDEKFDTVCVVLEWSDLDTRLGYRQLGGWGRSVHDDVLSFVSSRLGQIRQGIELAAKSQTVIVTAPTLPLPPVSFTKREQASRVELQLRRLIDEFLVSIEPMSGVRIVSSEHIDRASPTASRLDIKSELVAGFPYATAHADVLGEALANLVLPRARKKALITDLDDTFWAGLVGEVGPAEVRFDLESGTQVHAIYQQFLAGLADAGVLIGIASRNDARVVEEALASRDFHIDAARLFPVEVHWGEKSESVRRILQAWNIASDAVVFIDDSPRELAEIAAVFPDIECRLFAGTREPAKVMALLSELRDLFGQHAISEEDLLRSASLAAAAEARPDKDGGTNDELLSTAEAEITVDLSMNDLDGRVLELVNKTNQFNLNGRRYTRTEWLDAAHADGAFVMTVGYRDRFGPLGRIAVLAGQRNGSSLNVSTWVMSCRAFARRIEHRSLQFLFEKFAAHDIRFELISTPRNEPIRALFREMTDDEKSDSFVLTREQFDASCPQLHHSVQVHE